MKYCKYCGSAIDSNSVFCEFCAGDLRVGADADKGNTPRPIPPLTPPTVRTGGDWCKLMYAAFAVWGLSFILLFLDWFTLNYTAGFLGDDTVMSFNLFSLDSLIRKTGESGLEILSIFVYIFSVIFVGLTIAAIALFLKRNRFMFGIGMALSSAFALFSAITLITVSAGMSSISSEDPLTGALVQNALEINAAPYILLIVSIAAFVMMLFARRGYIDEFGRPEKKVQNVKLLETVLEFAIVICCLFMGFISLISSYFYITRSYYSFFDIISLILSLIISLTAVGYIILRKKLADKKLYILTAMVLGILSISTLMIGKAGSIYLESGLIPLAIIFFIYIFCFRKYNLNELNVLSVIAVIAGLLSSLFSFPFSFMLPISPLLFIFAAIVLAVIIIFLFFKKRRIHFGCMLAMAIALILCSILSLSGLLIGMHSMIYFTLILTLTGIFIILLSVRLRKAQAEAPAVQQPEENRYSVRIVRRPPR